MNSATSYRSSGLGAAHWQKIPTLHVFSYPRGFRRIGLALAAALGYYLGTMLGFALTPAGSPISALWPPNAILLAVFLLSPVRKWWIPILAVLPVHLFIQLRMGIPVTTATGWFVGNVSEALLGAALVLRFVDARKVFETVNGTIIFLLCAVILAPLATTFVDAGTVILTGMGKHYWTIWSERFFSNALAELIFVPIIVSFWTDGRSWIKESNPARYMEAAGLAVGLLFSSFLAFGMESPRFHASPALIYVPLPLLLWAALRFGLGGLSLSMLTVSLVSIAGAMNGRGPFSETSMNVTVVSLQILLCTVATPLILLTSVMTERKRVQDSLREVAQKLIGAQELERERIARELHDDIGQQLALVEFELDELKNEVGNSWRPEVVGIIGRVAGVSRSARDLSHGLHPSTIEYLGLVTALKALCADLTARKSVQVKFESDNVGRPPATVALCLYRIAQEAVQNVLRHSQASDICVRLSQTGNCIRLCISDNGHGFNVEKPAHAGLGLIGMRERLRVLDGDLRISSGSEIGTTLNVTIPLHRDF